MSGIALHGNFAGVNLAGQNLTNANFNFATLTHKLQPGQPDWGILQHCHADQCEPQPNQSHRRKFLFLHSDGREPDRGGSERQLTSQKTERNRDILAQLYSTASYQSHDLTGIGLGNTNLSDANLAGQNLTNAIFYGSTLAGANLNGANLANVSLAGNLTNTNFSQANLATAEH